jgi:tetratricopeptide (TPR) repeat protein/cellulose biosynthesis protein BcsQ
MSLSSGIGSVITFYSWKGGVGRTLALANTAVQLSRAGHSVLMIDWDLEAPGLDRYFLHPGDLEARSLGVVSPEIPGGLLALLLEANKRGDGYFQPAAWRRTAARISVPGAEPTFSAPYPPTPGRLDLLSAGDMHPSYAEDLSSFSWRAFFSERRGGEWLEAARKQWVEEYDFVLIDSRTGLTDSGGICTIQMPDTLVLVFAANDQSFEGGLRTVRAAQKARRDYGYDRGLLSVVPLLSRWCGDEETDIAERWMKRFDVDLAPVVASWLPRGFSPRQFLERLRVPHVARFTFGEPLPVLTHSLSDPALPGLAFDMLARLLASRLADAGRVVDPAYEAPKYRAGFTQESDLRLLSLADDPAALHQELGRLARTYGEDSSELADALTDISRILRRTARYTEAEPLVRRALAIDERLRGPDDPVVANRLMALALILRDTGRFAEGELLLRRALNIYEHRVGGDSTNFAAALNNLGQLLTETGRIHEAEPLLQRSLAIVEKVAGEQSLEVANALDSLSLLLQKMGRFGEAEPLVRRALAIDESNLGRDHPSVATRLNNLAVVLRTTNRLNEAEPLLRRALAIDEASFGKDHPEVANDLTNLAAVLHDTRRLGEAEELLQRALAIHEASFGGDHVRVAVDLNNLAMLHREMGNLGEAQALTQRALQILNRFQQNTGRTHPNQESVIKNYEGSLRETHLDEAQIKAALEPFINDGSHPS